MDEKPTKQGKKQSNKVRSGNSNQVMVELVKHHQALLQLCARLEHIADNLPHEIDHQECLMLARTIYPTLKRSHDFEENNLFPELRRINVPVSQLEQSLERLKFEHWEDESFAEEISASLMIFVREPDKRNTESLSYMLRGFFEGKRRHLAFETEYLFPLLQSFQASSTNKKS